MVHYFDPHLIYEPPREYRRQFALEQDRETDDPVFGSMQEIFEYRYKGFQLEEETIRRLEGLHNGEVAYSDRELERLLAGIAARGLDESTIVVITSDHGEEFFDHGGFEHGHSLYDELLHIPLMIRWPGKVPAGTEVESTVRHIDLAPTLCSLAGVEPGGRFEGDDLAPLWSGSGPHPDRPVFSEGNFWGELRFSRRADGYLVIAHQENRRIEVYDLANDPGLKDDLSARNPELRQRLFADMMLSRRGMVIDPGSPMPADLSQEQRDRLKKLGYL
jgi:arylsulfatase A-like enzyme